jgi:hypothetical protein
MTDDEVMAALSDERASIRRANEAIEEVYADETREKHRAEDRIGWTPEKAKAFEPGHPWADPAAYPSASDILRTAARPWPHSLEVWGFPSAAHFHQLRHACYAQTLLSARVTLQLYDQVRTVGAQALAPERLAPANGNEFEIAAIVRRTLATLYTQISGIRSRAFSMRAKLIENGEMQC